MMEQAADHLTTGVQAGNRIPIRTQNLPELIILSPPKENVIPPVTG